MVYIRISSSELVVSSSINHFINHSISTLRCEAAAYAWIQQFCPKVPIPQLYGFGLSSGQRFTRSDFLPWWSRWVQRARCSILALFGLPLPSHYVGHPARHVPRLETGYLIIELIPNAEMLSETWKEKHDDASLQGNLCRDLARIILSLASIPLPRIGAFRLDDNGYLHLDNRPLSTEIVMQENEGIPVEIFRNSTFSTVDEFILKQLALFDTRTVHQPNAIESNGDGYRQMSSLAAARAAFPQMFRQDLRSGPFAFTLTDLHPSNIIVDDEWNIISIIDLEFSCSWPLEFQQPPYWLGGEFVDELDQETFGPRHEQFVQALEAQERLLGRSGVKSLSSIMREAWASGTFWITLAFMDPIGFTDIFHDRIVPYHLSYITEEVKFNDFWFLASLWRPNDAGFLERKLKDRERYLEELETLAGNEEGSKMALNGGTAKT
ncbi:unnamed protein product [Zymoseptoria tritici ST99CH_3D1]|nr:unnamed protein product [Zymoseptoria tritici ST99CH_3D1]